MRLSWKSWEVRFWVKFTVGLALFIFVATELMANLRASENRDTRKYRETHDCHVLGVSSGEAVIYQCTDGRLLKEYP